MSKKLSKTTEGSNIWGKSPEGNRQKERERINQGDKETGVEIGKGRIE